MPSLPTPDSIGLQSPRGTLRVASTTVRSADMGDDVIGVTAHALQQAGMHLGEIGAQQRDRGRKLNLLRAKSLLATGLIKSEEESAKTPYGERLGVFQKTADNAYAEAAKLLEGDPEGQVEFEAHALPSIANYGSRVSLSTLKDERNFAVADYKEASLQATQELGRTPVGDIAANTVIINRMAERIQTLVDMQAITPEQAQAESAALRETYAKVQFDKLDAKGQLDAVKKARSSKHKGWESYLPAQQLDDMHDAAEAELKVENTKRNGQAKFDAVYAKYKGNSAAQIKDIRADKSLSPEERDDAIARVDRQHTRDLQARKEREDATGNAARKWMADGRDLKDFPSRELLKLPLKEQEYLQRIQDARDARARAAVEQTKEDVEKTTRGTKLRVYEDFMAQVGSGDLAGVAQTSFSRIEALMPEEHWASAKKLVTDAQAALTKQTSEAAKPVKAAQYQESALNDALKAAYIDLGISGKGDKDTSKQLELKAAVREELDRKRAELRGKDATLTATDVQEVVKRMTLVVSVQKPGRIFGSAWPSTEKVPLYQIDELNEIPADAMDKVLAEFPEVLKQQGRPTRAPTAQETIRLYKLMVEEGRL